MTIIHKQFATCRLCKESASRTVAPLAGTGPWAHLRLPADHHAPAVDPPDVTTCRRCASDQVLACPDLDCPNAATMRAAVLAIHKPTHVWTDSVITADGEQQEALYDETGGLVYAPDVHTVCEGCDIRNDVPWPCPTARAVGVDE